LAPAVEVFLPERNVMTVKGIRLCHDSYDQEGKAAKGAVAAQESY
jgi:hypothetical protein